MTGYSTLEQKWQAQYGPWAVITGASDGIGREMALLLARAGLNLVLIARRETILQALAAELEQQHGVQTLVIAADLSRMDDVEKTLEATAHLKVGMLVASAGFGTTGALIDVPLERELNMLDVNCRAVLVMSQAFGQRFAKQGRGGIVLMSSLLAFQGVPKAAHYAATKAYIQTLAEGLRLELAPYGVDVLASAPGPIHSGFAARADQRMTLAMQPETVAHSTLKALGKTATVRPGWLSRLLEAALTLLPRWGRSRVLGFVMNDMTKHQHSSGIQEHPA